MALIVFEPRRAVEDHLDLRGTGLDRVVYEFARCGGRVPVAAPALGLESLPGVEQRVGVVLR